LQNPFEIPLFRLGRIIVALKPALIDAIGVEGLVFTMQYHMMQARGGL